MRVRTPPTAATPGKKTLLFVCIGNACRSQMAEAFAKRYGSDIAAVSSAGLSPGVDIPELTKTVMINKNIPLEGHFPKGVETMTGTKWDVIVNISGQPLPAVLGADRKIEWKVQDPMGQRQPVHEKVRDEIENLVMRLILELRNQSKRARWIA